MILRIPWVLLILMVIFYQAVATNLEEYELLLIETNLLIRYNTPSDESLALIDSAKSAAFRQDYELAIVYLEIVMSELYKKPGSIQNELIINNHKSADNTDFKIITGLDFNRQEFEVGYIETDSVILSEVNKPFIGLSTIYHIAGTRQHGISSRLYIRADRENIEGRFRLSNPYKKSQLYGYNSFEFNYDNNSENRDIGYWELAGRQSLNYTISQWFFQFENYFRYKNYNKSSQSIPEFVKNVTNVSALYEQSLIKNLRLSYQADLNESIHYRNNDFLEHIAEINFLNWIPGPISNEISGNFSYNDFTYTLEDSVINNISKTAYGKTYIRTSLFSGLYWNMNYTYRYKIYDIKSEQDPDYWEHEFDTSIQKEFIRNLSIGLGYHYQKREHKITAGSNEIYIKEQNYSENGLLAEINYHYSTNMLFTGSITYSKRVYPETGNVDLMSFYKSKNILNLFIIFQIPIYSNLGINVFLCYDGDRELDNDKNDTRSIIYSMELEYNF
jgi:hypothetical protein